MSDINLNVWPIQHNTTEAKILYPEQKFAYVKVTDKSVGVAASGGGSRSHALCSGYYRAFRELKLTEKVSYISSVSGGTWASSIYTYAKMDDQELLGEVMEPEKCNLDYLKEHHPGELGNVITHFFGVFTALYEIWKGEKMNKLWQRMIGLTLLRPFGLHKKIFGYNEAHKKLILDLNKDNKKITVLEEEVVLPKPGRPYLIMNAVLGGPKGYSSGWGASLQFTPLYSGVPFYANEDYSYHTPVTRLGNILSFALDLLGIRGDDYLNNLQEEQFSGNSGWRTKKLISGGGVISTFAFGTESLKDRDAYYGALNTIGTINTGEPFYLEDAVGASSAAYVAAFENRSLLDFNPQSPFIPVLQRDSEKFTYRKYKGASTRAMADGGNFENTGILPLVQRGLKRIIALINTPCPMLEDSSKFVDNQFQYDGQDCADSQLLSLFGAVEYIEYGFNYTQNQIFATEDLNVVMRELMAQRDAGLGAVVKKTMKIVENKYWNIKGGDEIEFLFVYNTRCEKFVDKLPKETQEDLKDDGFFSTFGDFPFYNTTFQNLRPFSLSRSQVNLGSAHAEYLLTTVHRDLVLSMFE